MVSSARLRSASSKLAFIKSQRSRSAPRSDASSNRPRTSDARANRAPSKRASFHTPPAATARVNVACEKSDFRPARTFVSVASAKFAPIATVDSSMAEGRTAPEKSAFESLALLNTARGRLAPVNIAPTSVEPVKSGRVPVVLEKSASTRSRPARIVAASEALRKRAPSSVAAVRSASSSTAREKSAFSQTVCVRSQPRRIVPTSRVPTNFDRANDAPEKSIPERSRPERSRSWSVARTYSPRLARTMSKTSGGATAVAEGRGGIGPIEGQDDPLGRIGGGRRGHGQRAAAVALGTVSGERPAVRNLGWGPRVTSSPMADKGIGAP